MKVEIVRGDITKLAVDAIVNAANEHLAFGGGVCGAIFRAAGGDLEAECRAIGHCPTGSAVVTGGHWLTARHIIHAVGPIWRGGDHGEPALLASCYRSALGIAADLGLRSVAFPAISTGIYGYPPIDAARVAVGVLREAAPTLDMRVVLVAFDAASEDVLRDALGWHV